MARYRPGGELEHWLEHDPLDVLTRRLVADSVAREADLDETRASVESQLDESVEWAKGRAHPQPVDALEDVYVDSMEGAALR